MKEPKENPMSLNRTLLVISKMNDINDVKSDSNVEATYMKTDMAAEGINNNFILVESKNYSQLSDSFLGVYDGC